jgi:hypothetical protein
MAKDRANNPKRRFNDLDSLNRMGEALGFPKKDAFDYDDVSDAEIKDDGKPLPKDSLKRMGGYAPTKRFPKS